MPVDALLERSDFHDRVEVEFARLGYQSFDRYRPGRGLEGLRLLCGLLFARAELIVVVVVGGVAVGRELLVRTERAPGEAAVCGGARVKRQTAADQGRGGEESAAVHVDVLRGYFRRPNAGRVSNEHILNYLLDAADRWFYSHQGRIPAIFNCIRYKPLRAHRYRVLPSSSPQAKL